MVNEEIRNDNRFQVCFFAVKFLVTYIFFWGGGVEKYRYIQSLSFTISIDLLECVKDC